MTEVVQRRTEARTRVLLTGEIISKTGSHTVLVRDLSRLGAQIYAQIPIDGDACLRRGPLFVAARVAWCRNGVAGLRFYRPLSSEQLEGAFPSASADVSEQMHPQAAVVR